MKDIAKKVIKFIQILFKFIFLLVAVLPYLLIRMLCRQVQSKRDFKNALHKSGVDKETVSKLTKNYPSIIKMIRTDR